MSFVEQNQSWFEGLSKKLFLALQGSEEASLGLHCEDTDFVRFNGGKVRQTTAVDIRDLSLTFQNRGRRVSFGLSGTGRLKDDSEKLLQLLERARHEVSHLPEDPGVSPFENHGLSHQNFTGQLLTAPEIPAVVEKSADQLDLAGLYAGGTIIKASRNSKGQSHWFSTRSFFLDYSLYTVNESGENKAVKNVYAGRDWETDRFCHGLGNDTIKLAMLKRPTIDVKPGEYRVYFAPAAVSSLVDILSWGALGYRSLKQGKCAFRKVADKEIQLSRKINLRENFNLGLRPRFNSLGEMAPETLQLIEGGEIKNFLVSSRTAKEYGIESNGAAQGFFSEEALQSPELGTGDLDAAKAIQKLGTGLFVANLHYLNWSDMQSARVTGMTRYACFWVENGAIKGPIKDLRFDDSFFHFWSENRLEALTKDAEIEPNTDTYERRNLGGNKIPGMLVDGFRFTL
jgi:predicted Zn-dependent protease